MHFSSIRKKLSYGNWVGNLPRTSKQVVEFNNKMTSPSNSHPKFVNTPHPYLKERKKANFKKENRK